MSALGCNEGVVPQKLKGSLDRYLVEVAHVALVPGEAFGASDCVRISYAASMETLDKALDRIVAALHPNKLQRRQAAACR